MSFDTIAQGTNSGIEEPRHVVVRTADEWQTLWNAHDQGSPPAVDFAASTVVGVFLGERPTAGYTVAIRAVRSAGGTTVVEYLEQPPQPGDLVAQVLTSPFHLIRLPRTSSTIEFRKVQP